MELAWLTAGFVVAALVSVTGVGGGAVMTPLLVLGLGVPLPIAIGTDLLYVVATKAGALTLHLRAGRVRWDVARRMLSGSLPAAALVVGLLAVVDGENRLEGLLRTALGAALALTAFTILFRDQLQQRWLRSSPDRNRMPTAALMATGAALGALVALTSVGAGALGLAAIMLLMPRLAARQAVATDLAQALPMALVAGAGHFALGNVDLELLVYLLLGAAPGVITGSWLSGALPETFMRRALAVVLAGVAALLVL